MHYATFGYASLWLMQGGDGRGRIETRSVNSAETSTAVRVNLSKCMTMYIVLMCR